MTTDTTEAAFDALDAMADEWMQKINGAGMAAAIANKPAAERAAAIEAMMHLAWTEGAYTGRTSHTTHSVQP